MKSETNNSSSGGIGFIGLLTIAFIVMKLTHVIDWSWWWVLAPIWVSVGLVVSVLLIFGAVMLVGYWVDKRHNRSDKKTHDQNVS